MKLWEAIKILQKYPYKFEIYAPSSKDLEEMPRIFYFVRIVHYFPNKNNAKVIYDYESRFIHKDPELTEVMIQNLEHQLDIKLNDFK